MWALQGSAFSIAKAFDVNLRRRRKLAENGTRFLTEGKIMDPQAFIRLTVGSLGLRVPSVFTSPCVCELHLRGFPVQTAQVPFISSPSETNPNSQISFYLKASDLKSLLISRGCFYNPIACLEIAIFTGRKGTHCVVGAKRHKVGTFKLDVGPEWAEGKPVVLFNGWTGIGKRESGKSGTDLHLRVTVEPDPRYVFQFEDETKLSPQIVQLQGTVKQPIFSCKFSRDRGFQGDPPTVNGSYQETDRRERKGWNVTIHDLSGSAIAAAFITTPFVPSNGCDWVSKSSPGAWLIVHPDPCRPSSWQPWGKLEAWRERRGIRDFICFRFNLLLDGQDDGKLLMSELSVGAEKGGEFSIDTNCRQVVGAGTTAAPVVPSDGVDIPDVGPGGGFVMSCQVGGEGKCGKALVHLAMRHVMCVEDAAIFMALGAAVDLSMEACRPFRRRVRRGVGNLHSW